MGKLWHLLLLVWASRESELLLVVVVGRRTVGQGLSSTPTPLCGSGSGGGGRGSGSQATQLTMITGPSISTSDSTNSSGAVGGGGRILIADGGRVGGALVASAVHAGAEGGTGVAVCDGRVVRDGGRRHLLHRERRLAPPAHAAQFE